MRTRPFLSLLAFTASVGLLGVPLASRAETLEESLYKAYQTNPQIRAAQALVRATDELAPQALANWRPTITATGETGWTRTMYDNTATTADATSETRNPKSMKLTINEYLYRGGRTIAATNVAENKILAERARLMVTESGILADTAAAYLRVLMQRELLAITSESEKGIADELAGTRRRFDMGERTKTDISQAETRHAKAVSDRVSAESDLAVAEAMYRGLVGEDAGPVTLPDFPQALPGKRETAVALALDANYGIAAAIYDEKAARANIKVMSGELMPTLAVQGTVGRDIETSTVDSRIDEASVKLVLSVPIYDGGLAYSKTRQARQTHSQSSITLEKAKRDASEAASKAWDTMSLAKDRIRVNEARVAAAKVALDNVSREQSFGTRSLVDVLDARQDLLDGRQALVRARNDLYVAAFQLKQAIGELTAVKLALGEPNYSPKPHYDEVRNKWVGGRSSMDKERGNTVSVVKDPPSRELAPLPSDIAPSPAMNNEPAAASETPAASAPMPAQEAAPQKEAAAVPPAATTSAAPPAATPPAAQPLPLKPVPSDIEMSPFSPEEAPAAIAPEAAPEPKASAPATPTPAPAPAPAPAPSPMPAKPEVPSKTEAPAATKVEAVPNIPPPSSLNKPPSVLRRSASPFVAQLDARE
jgi:outer membrane protein